MTVRAGDDPEAPIESERAAPLGGIGIAEASRVRWPISVPYSAVRPYCIPGIGFFHAAALEKAFNIKTIRQLGSNKYLRCRGGSGDARRSRVKAGEGGGHLRGYRWLTPR